VADVGTGATISGVGKVSQGAQNPAVRVIAAARAVPPVLDRRPPARASCPAASGGSTSTEVIAVDDKAACGAVMEVARKESIFVGSSGGAAGRGGIDDMGGV